jgi:hypothetical protein
MPEFLNKYSIFYHLLKRIVLRILHAIISASILLIIYNDFWVVFFLSIGMH